LVLHQARQALRELINLTGLYTTLRELINLTGLYTKVRPHIHLSLNKHGRLNLKQRTNIKQLSADVEKGISNALHGDALVVRAAHARAAEWQPDLHLFRAVTTSALSDDWVAMT
jgi:hypothetical protein